MHQQGNPLTKHITITIAQRAGMGRHRISMTVPPISSSQLQPSSSFPLPPSPSNIKNPTAPQKHKKLRHAPTKIQKSPDKQKRNSQIKKATPKQSNKKARINKNTQMRPSTVVDIRSKKAQPKLSSAQAKSTQERENISNPIRKMSRKPEAHPTASSQPSHLESHLPSQPHHSDPHPDHKLCPMPLQPSASPRRRHRTGTISGQIIRLFGEARSGTLLLKRGLLRGGSGGGGVVSIASRAGTLFAAADGRGTVSCCA